MFKSPNHSDVEVMRNPVDLSAMGRLKSGEGLWDGEDVQKNRDLASINKIGGMSNDPIPKTSEDIQNIKNSIVVNSD